MSYLSKMLLPGCLALTALAATSTHAQNLVKDGTFEAADNGAQDGSEDPFAVGDLIDSHWQITQGIVAVDTNNEFIYDGSKSLYLNADPTGSTTLSQTFQTQIGKQYLLSFYANDDGDNPLTVSFGRTTLEPIAIPQNGYPNSDPGSNASQFTFYSYTVTASSAATDLTFLAPYNGEPGVELDDISVTPVPEAATILSFGLLLALGGLTLAVRRQKARA